MSGRIRTVKPEWLEDEKLAAASDEARVLSIALILLADDYGRGRASIATIAAGAWRYQMERDDGRHAPEILARASRALRELVAMHFVDLYDVNGQRYFAIVHWARHQKVDKPSKPRVPPPPSLESLTISEIRETLAKPSRVSRESLAKPSRLTSDLRPPTSDPDHGAGREDEGGEEELLEEAFAEAAPLAVESSADTANADATSSREALRCPEGPEATGPGARTPHAGAEELEDEHETRARLRLVDPAPEVAALTPNRAIRIVCDALEKATGRRPLDEMTLTTADRKAVAGTVEASKVLGAEFDESPEVILRGVAATFAKKIRAGELDTPRRVFPYFGACFAQIAEELAHA